MSGLTVLITVVDAKIVDSAGTRSWTRPEQEAGALCHIGSAQLCSLLKPMVPSSGYTVTIELVLIAAAAAFADTMQRA
jgi:hypothetical protein